MIIGLVHPGEMGAALGGALRTAGHQVLWASAGRSSQTAARAKDAGLEDAGEISQLAGRCEVIISVCPPHAARAVADSFGSFPGIYVDANAISPATAQMIASSVRRYVDGGIVGPPPRRPGTTCLYLSGGEAPATAELFAGTPLETIVVSEQAGGASAIKMAYAAWTKGSAALLLAVRAVARAEGVEQLLLDAWEASRRQLPEQSAAAAHAAVGKGWRWIGEMNEIADTFAAAGLPEGFHRAAAEIFRRSPSDAVPDDDVLGLVLDALIEGSTAPAGERAASASGSGPSGGRAE